MFPASVATRRVLASLLIVAAALGLAARLSAAQPDERWYAVMLLGERAGWLREAVSAEPDGALRQETEMRLTLARGGLSIAVELRTESVESAEGRPIRMRSEQHLAAAPVVTEYTFTPGGVEIVEQQGGRTTRRTAPVPAGDWLAPLAAARHVEARVKAGADVIEYVALDPSVGLEPLAVTRRRKAQTAPVEVLGKTVPAAAWTVTQSLYPGVESTDYLGVDGALVRGDMNFGGMTLMILAADRETATAPANAPEMMVNTFIHPSRPIASPRSMKRATYIVRLPEGQSLPVIPSVGYQRAERLDDRSARVSVDVRSPGLAEPNDRANADFSTPSAMIDSDDPAVRAIVPQDAAGMSPADRARRLRGVVHGHITSKTLDVGLATASEVARTREGDCTEHAVLLAAVLRAAGVSSRVASGVVYVDQFAGGREVFGFHMWTQALLEDDSAPGSWRWIDLDATLPDGVVFDAAHIAFAVSGLPASERVNALAVLAPLLGRLEIEVVSSE